MRTCACATAPLDLRRTPMREALELRHRVVQTMRAVLDERDFLEIETPFLTRSTPEGARDFLVPARTELGSFYALPQSPQLFKQLLMVGGLERYYQIVRCFRDEDSRADRLPEFTQLDIEMAFVDEDDVIGLMEAVFSAVFTSEGFEVQAAPWPRITWAEAMSRWGSDRPDRRFGLELVDLSDAVRSSEFQVFSGALAGGFGRRPGRERWPPRTASLRSGRADRVRQAVRRQGSGLGVRPGGRHRCARRSRSSCPRLRLTRSKRRFRQRSATRCSSSLTRVPVARAVLGALRLELARRFALIADDAPHDLLWVVEFPMFACRR